MTTTIFSRNLLSSVELGGVEDLDTFYQYANDPLSTHYVYPSWYDPNKKVTSWSLAEWLLEVHRRRGWVPYFSNAINMRHAKRLLQMYDHELLLKATHYASQVATMSFSFKLVEKCLSEKFLKELM